MAGRLQDVILRGTRAAQPLATTVAIGTLYCVSNEGNIIERSTGAAWEAYSPSAPSAAAITQLTGDVTAGPGSGSQVATIGNDKVITAKILDANVTTGKIANDAVTYAKIQNISLASALLGRGSAAGAGDVEEITLGSGLSMAGTVLSSSGGGTGEVTKTTKIFTDAEARAWGTTPQLIVAGVAGKFISVVDIILHNNISVYGGIQVNATLRYVGNLGSIMTLETYISSTGVRFISKSKVSFNTVTDLRGLGIEFVPSASAGATYATTGGSYFVISYILFTP